MKKSLKIASLYIGTVIGAGFASGKEILTFFLGRGSGGFAGLMVSGGLLCLLPCLMMLFCYDKSIENTKEFSDYAYGKFLSPFADGFTKIFLFCSFFVMLSGSGALFNQCFNLPKYTGIFFMAFFCFFILLFDLKGIIGLNALLSPLMIAGILITGTTYLITESTFAFSSCVKAAVKSPILCALVYAGYNIITLPPLFVSAGKSFTKKQAIPGIITGGAVLLSVSAFMWLLLKLSYTKILPLEIPFLYFATSKASLYLYFAVLLCAMLTTATASAFSLINSFFAENCPQKKLFAFFVCAFSIPFAFTDFSLLVSDLYGVFGAISLIFAGIFVCNYAKFKAKRIKQKK